MERRNIKTKALLDIEFPQDLQEIWTQEVAQKIEIHFEENITLVVFKLANEWLALNVNCFKDVVSTQKIHSIPGKNITFLEGLVNIEGELLIKVNPSEILGLSNYTLNEKKFIILEYNSNCYVIGAEDFAGVIKIHSDKITKAPSINYMDFNQALNELKNSNIINDENNNYLNNNIEKNENDKNSVIMGIFKIQFNENKQNINSQKSNLSETSVGIIRENKFFEMLEAHILNENE